MLLKLSLLITKRIALPCDVPKQRSWEMFWIVTFIFLKDVGLCLGGCPYHGVEK